LYIHRNVYTNNLKKMEYTILTSMSREHLMEMVNNHLKLGWEISQGVSISHTETLDRNSHISRKHSYAQAMTKNNTPLARPDNDENLYYRDEAGQKCYYAVDHCPGIGEKTKATMARYNILYLYELVGQFMCLQRDKDIFSDWLKDNFETMKTHDIKRCAKAISKYVRISI